MEIPKQFADNLPLSEKILYVLSVLGKGSPDEVAMEIMELQGISSEEGVADLTDETAKEIAKLCEEGLISKIKEHRQKSRYMIKENALH